MKQITCTQNILDYILTLIYTSLSLEKDNVVIPSFNFHERKKQPIFKTCVPLQCNISRNSYLKLKSFQLHGYGRIFGNSNGSKRCLMLGHFPYRP